jgi:hypothetical protein
VLSRSPLRHGLLKVFTMALYLLISSFSFLGGFLKQPGPSMFAMCIGVMPGSKEREDQVVDVPRKRSQEWLLLV